MNAMYCMCHHKTHLLKLEFYSQWTLGGEDFGKNYMMNAPLALLVSLQKLEQTVFLAWETEMQT